jgi:hypothetical protein
MAIITFKTFNSSIEANMIKGILESNGIQCFLTNENFSTLMPGYSGMLGGGIQLMIDDKDLDAAQSIINKPNDFITCPKCNSENVRFNFGPNKFKRFFLLLISLLAFTAPGNIPAEYYCKDCKNRFKLL